ncbi:SHOCT domain-containing protein [Halieaceae bacterium IMCC14734]|uniref:SHOCT domain-containing protein n=1 Tax=Candidatus Litorirhabdus singularis TaxID=2518993 RepID=A0ABT3TMA7_9GAMM|nr:SHOCT domain-containing protein [Candidatus Litorirhabdus singularis]MCX2982880.1 SHOCT domain-containing protein [Candidatus Litorirhabdus singularis]
MPVASYKLGDDEMSCQELKAELAYINAQVAELVPETKKTGKNVALGVAGWFLIVPWFFMDLSDAEKVEIQAYQERYMALEKLYIRNGCTNAGQENGVETADIEEYENSTIAVRLRVLEDLHEQGVLTEEEYSNKRKSIIEGF